MTSKEIIEKIRAEVERQREEIRPTDTGEMKVVGTPTQLEQGWLNALSWMEKVLDTLQEQPVCEGLEEEITKWFAELDKKYGVTIDFGCADIESTARHFYDLGRQSKETGFPTTDEEMEEFLATHPKVEFPEKYKTPDWMFEKPSEELEEEYKNYVENDPVYSKLVNGIVGLSIARHFAKWQKEQMMKEAVDATVIAMKSGDKYCQAYITDRNSLANMCNGDTVKLIIVKEVKE